VAAGNNSTPGEVQALVTEIQNYEKFGASFDQAQGGIFDARFGNELRGGTLLADTNNAIHGLQGIANGDTGAALAADQAQIQAAGMGFVADANDVSGNNIPVGGGTFVGTSTTVAGATSPGGVAQGTIPVAGTASGKTGLAVAGGAAGDPGGNVTGGDHGGGHNLLSDLTGPLHGGGQNGLSAPTANSSAQGAGVHGSVAPTSLADALTGAADSGATNPAPVVQHVAFEQIWHHG
jgi:hypothetical protein